jgi:uncharacterized membrane protein
MNFKNNDLDIQKFESNLQNSKDIQDTEEDDIETEDTDASTLLDLVNEYSEASEIIEKLDPKTQMAVARFMSFQGPLPPPELFNGYGEYRGNIVAMAEKNQEHIINKESKALAFAGRDNLIAYLTSFILYFILIIFAFMLLNNDKSVEGFAVLAAGVAPIVKSFFDTSKNRYKE